MWYNTIPNQSGPAKSMQEEHNIGGVTLCYSFHLLNAFEMVSLHKELLKFSKQQAYIISY